MRTLRFPPISHWENKSYADMRRWMEEQVRDVKLDPFELQQFFNVAITKRVEELEMRVTAIDGGHPREASRDEKEQG